MTLAEILRLPGPFCRKHWVGVIVIVALIASAAVYPSDLDQYRATPYPGNENALVVGVEAYGRHVNTAVALAVPVLLRDWTGLKQLAVVALSGVLATHIPKRLLNRIEIFGTRLGERPYSPDSRYNMPSGHSALASAVIWFLGRRYSWWFLLLMVPVTGLTMWARVMLNAHTVSAVIAGCLIGILVAMLFVTQRREHAQNGAPTSDIGRGRAP